MSHVDPTEPSSLLPAETDDLPLSPIPWENRREISWPFWRTVIYMMRKRGALAEELDGYLDLRSAKGFRWIATSFVFFGMLLMLISSVALAYDRQRQGGGLAPFLNRESQLVVAGVISLVSLVAWWALLLGAVAVMKWFVAPARLGEHRQHNALAMNYYFSASLVWVGAGAIVAAGFIGIGVKEPVFAEIGPWVVLAGLAFSLFYMLSTALWFMRKATHSSMGGTIAAAVALPVMWVVLLLLPIWLPLSLVMWFFLIGTVS